MSLKRYYQERFEALQGDLLQKGTDLAIICRDQIDNEFVRGTTVHLENTTFDFTRMGRELEARGYCEATEPEIDGNQLRVERRIFVVPTDDDEDRVGEERIAYFIGGAELPEEREGLEGPFGVLIFMSRGSSQAEEVVPKCYVENPQQGEAAPGLAPALVDDLLAAFHSH